MSTPRPELRLRTFDWSNLIKSHFLESMLVGMLGALLVLVESGAAHLKLTILCLVLAFIRVWRAIREEHEWSPVWDQVVECDEFGCAGEEQVRDTMMEMPYVLAIMVLPFASVNVWAFAWCLLIFYISDSYYTTAIIQVMTGKRIELQPQWWRSFDAWVAHRMHRLAPRLVALRRIVHRLLYVAGAILSTLIFRKTDSPLEIDRLTVVRSQERYLRQRGFALWLLIALLIAMGVARWHGVEDDWLWVPAVVFTIILIMEALFSPDDATEMPYVDEVEDESEGDATDDEASIAKRIMLWPVHSGEELDAASRTALQRIHEEAFRPDEQQITAEMMLAKTSDRQNALYVLTLNAQVRGYALLHLRPHSSQVILWYIAVDHDLRGLGAGGAMMRSLLNRVRERWPWAKSLLLESRSPADFPADSDESQLAQRRIGFYATLGALRANGVDYQVPAAEDPHRLLRYEVLIIPLDAGETAQKDSELRDAVEWMLREAWKENTDAVDVSSRIGTLEIVEI